MSKTHTIITIGRQFGSGGREIGKRLADELGIEFYDKELLSRAAKDSKICKELFETHDEKPTNSFPEKSAMLKPLMVLISRSSYCAFSGLSLCVRYL